MRLEVDDFLLGGQAERRVEPDVLGRHAEARFEFPHGPRTFAPALEPRGISGQQADHSASSEEIRTAKPGNNREWTTSSSRRSAAVV